ncbi:MAG: hypothetical protein JSU73_00255 [candidate division WOR-3 bacterium]|nr:MAG: hypothetical protein JSU73_00255 [candidate division WOR-3 bacterium]
MARPARTTSLLLAAFVACAAIDLTTFRTDYAHHALLDWSLGGGADARSYDDSTKQESSQRLSLRGSADYRIRTLSDDVDWELDFPAGAEFRRKDRQVTTPDTAFDLSDRTADVEIAPGFQARFYQGGTDLFLTGGARGSTGWERHERRADIPALSSSRWLHLQGNAGVGYGRVRDAWPLLKAVRVSDILQDEGVLDRALTPDELQDLAGFISRSWRLFLAHERPAKHYYDSLEHYLRRAGAIRRSLPARALMRLDEELFVGSYERPFGWRAWATVAGWTELAHEYVTGEDTSELATTEGDFEFEAGADYARPVGLNWLFTGTVSYRLHEVEESRYVNIYPYEFRLGAAASWQALDRLSVDLGLNACPVYRFTEYLTYRPTPPSHHLETPFSLAAGISYYAAEHLRIVAGVGCSGYRDFDWDRYGFEHSGRAFWTLNFKLHLGRLPSGWGVRYYL